MNAPMGDPPALPGTPCTWHLEEDTQEPNSQCTWTTAQELESTRRFSNDWREVKLVRKLTMQQALTLEQTKLSRDPWVLNPSTNTWLQWWDLGTVAALSFVAIVTPVEVAVLDTRLDAMFALNRVLDLVFVIDMVLQFCVAYRVKTPIGTRLETRRFVIRRHYLRTWFPIDLLSILPFDIAGLLVEDAALAKAKFMRVLRLARLVKLVRVLRASRVFHRWETSIAINYNTLKLLFAFVVFLLASHWIACVWAMLGLQGEDGEETWIHNAAPYAGPVPSGPAEVYFTALYWSAMTVTSVGYGDVVPVNLTERLFCTLLMFASGFLWAYALGEVMSALGNTNIHESNFRQMLDDLNHMMADRHLPKNLQRRLRSFFFQIKDLARVQGYKKIVEHLSPSLQGELAKTVNEVWVRKVWYFNCKYMEMPADFTSALATNLEVSVHAQQESVHEPWTLYILHRGLCVRRMRILLSGSVWGEDFILACSDLLETSVAFCLTFIELSRLTRSQFTETVRRYPEVWPLVRYAVVRMAVRRGILLEASRRRLAAKGHRRRGFLDLVASTPGCEQDFPLSIGGPSLQDEACSNPAESVEEGSETYKKLQSLAAKQAQMQLQLDETRTMLTDHLRRIEEKLSGLPRHRVSSSSTI